MVAAGALLTSMAYVGAAGPASATPATFTGTNSAADGGTAHCLNGSGLDPVNCNIYDGKDHVWLNAGPANAALPDGTYFFAVLVPGGQHTPNDGGVKNLSDGVNGDNGTRTFTVSGGVLTYTGTHNFANNKIRLMPYDDTTNPGGVYILAICNAPHPAAPAQCKYDAFKVPTDTTGGGAKVNAVFSGTKWLDDSSADGVLGVTETGLAGWTINIYKGTSTTPTASPVTDAAGEWTWTEPDQDVTTGSTTFTICEVMQTGWRQTGPTDASTVGVTGGASASLTGALADASRCYSVGVPNDALATASSLDFFNIRQGSVTGAKYYDSNADGLLSTGEAPVQGWKIEISKDSTFATGVTTKYTAADGSFTAGGLDPGTYYVREAQGSNGWTQTGNVSYQGSDAGVTILGKVYTVVVSPSTATDVTKLYFGNVCTIVPGGHTLGFWSNKNGQKLITAADLTSLRALNLRNANGSAFDPTVPGQVASWLLNGSATNMAYMLSVQMTATYLSTQHGFTNAAAVVDGTNTVTQEIAYANSLLASPIASGTFAGLNGGLTVGASALRAEQERVKSILDLVNNNGSFQQPDGTPCGAPFVIPS